MDYLLGVSPVFTPILVYTAGVRSILSPTAGTLNAMSPTFYTKTAMIYFHQLYDQQLCTHTAMYTYCYTFLHTKCHTYVSSVVHIRNTNHMFSQCVHTSLSHDYHDAGICQDGN
jgi:hypothetical protein